jgi:uncharacterized membrane protein YdbT with pleckstrin-like domain
MINPFDVTIQNQADDEEIIRVWRRHPVTLIGPLFKILAFAAIPIALILITGFSFLGSPILFALFMVILGVVVTFGAYQWVSWYGDVYVLTNYRIIDVEQQGFFSRSFAETTLNNIQDISHEVTGVAATLWDYGTIVVQTAGASPDISLNQIGHPQASTVYLLKNQQKYLKDHDDDMSAEQLLSLLAKHGDKLDKIAQMEKEEKVSANEEQMKKAATKKKSKKG